MIQSRDWRSKWRKNWSRWTSPLPQWQILLFTSAPWSPQWQETPSPCTKTHHLSKERSHFSSSVLLDNTAIKWILPALHDAGRKLWWCLNTICMFRHLVQKFIWLIYRELMTHRVCKDVVSENEMKITNFSTFPSIFGSISVANRGKYLIIAWWLRQKSRDVSCSSAHKSKAASLFMSCFHHEQNVSCVEKHRDESFVVIWWKINEIELN